MPSLKRPISNTNFQQTSSESWNHKVTKIPKRRRSWKSTPLTIKEMKDSPISSGDNEHVDIRDQANIHYCVNQYTNSNFSGDDILPHKQILMSAKALNNSIKSRPSLDKVSSIGDIHKVSKHCVSCEGSLSYDDGSIKSDASEPSSTRKSYLRMSSDDLKMFFKKVKFKTTENVKHKVGTKKSSTFMYKNDPTVSISEQSISHCEQNTVKPILKSSVRKSYPSDQRKSVRFNLEFQKGENGIPKSLQGLFVPPILNIKDQIVDGEFSHNSDIHIPEKDILDDEKSKNRFQVVSTEIKDLQTSSSQVTSKQSEPGLLNESNNIYLDKLNKISLVVDNSKEPMIPELGPNEIRRNDEETKYKSKKLHLNKMFLTKVDNIKPESFPKQAPIKKQTRMVNVATPITKNSIPNNESLHHQNQLSENKSLSNRPNLKDCSTNTSDFCSPEVCNDSDLYGYFFDNLLKCPRKEILCFLETLSVALEEHNNLNSTTNSSMLNSFLNDERNNIAKEIHTWPRRRSKQRKISPEISGAKCNSKVVSTSGKFCIPHSSSCSSSSVTSVSSLDSLMLNRKQQRNEVNMKTLRFLHQCMEETYCCDNISDKSSTKTEFRNYSHSGSSESKKKDSAVINSTLQKLTMLVEELNTKVDKITMENFKKSGSNESIKTPTKQYPDIKGSKYVHESKSGLLELKEEIYKNESKNISKSISDEEIENKLDVNDYNAFSSKVNKETLDKPEGKNITQPEDENTGNDKTICTRKQVMGANLTSEKTGIIFYSQSESEAFIKFIGKSRSEKQVLPPSAVVSSPVLFRKPTGINNYGNYPNKSSHGDDYNFLRSSTGSESLPISGADVQSILKRINEGINKVKLTCPSMYEPCQGTGGINKRPYNPKITLSQVIQKGIHNFLQSVFKFIPHREKTKPKTLNNSDITNERRKCSEETKKFNMFGLLFPFCKVCEESDDDQDNKKMRLINIKAKHKKEIHMQTESEGTSENESFNELWPDIKRTKYPNGMLYYGPLLRMPEPKLTASSISLPNTLKEYDSISSSLIYNKTVLKKLSL